MLAEIFFTLVPSRPRNVKVIVKRNTLNVSWEAPRYISGGDLHFLIFWRRVASNQEYQQRNATESPYVIKDLCKYVKLFSNLGRQGRGGGMC
jgi:hypothetical protein